MVATAPFLIPLVAVLMLVTFVPEISMWLPTPDLPLNRARADAGSRRGFRARPALAGLPAPGVA